MSAKPGKTKPRPLSRGQRKHVRRMKEEAKRAGIPYRPPFAIARPSAAPRKDEANT
jgi:hypothetical protein